MNRRPTPETDALREVIIGQYKEDELTGNGMGNILAALTDIETLERERDEALAYADKLAAGLPEGMLPKDVEVLRDANLALAVALEELNSINAERAEHRGMRKAWIKLDDNRQILEKQLTSERALADRLAEELEKLAWLAGHEVPNEAEKALAAWKEARDE